MSSKQNPTPADTATATTPTPTPTATTTPVSNIWNNESWLKEKKALDIYHRLKWIDCPKKGQCHDCLAYTDLEHRTPDYHDGTEWYEGKQFCEKCDNHGATMPFNNCHVTLDEGLVQDFGYECPVCVRAEEAAVLIQKVARGYVARKYVKEMKATATTPTPTAVDKPTTFPKKNKHTRPEEDHKWESRETEIAKEVAKKFLFEKLSDDIHTFFDEAIKKDPFMKQQGRSSSSKAGYKILDRFVKIYKRKPPTPTPKIPPKQPEETVTIGCHLRVVPKGKVYRHARESEKEGTKVTAKPKRVSFASKNQVEEYKIGARVILGKRTRSEEVEHKPKQSCLKKLKPTPTTPTPTPKVVEWFKALFEVFVDRGGPYGYLSKTEVCRAFYYKVSDEALNWYKDKGLLNHQTLEWGSMDAMTRMMINCLTEQEIRAFCFGDHKHSDLADYMRNSFGWNEPATPKVEDEHKEHDEEEAAYKKALPQDGSSVSLREASDACTQAQLQVAVYLCSGSVLGSEEADDEADTAPTPTPQPTQKVEDDHKEFDEEAAYNKALFHALFHNNII